MMECVSNCIHCQNIFNGNNLKVERRRKVGKHSDVDLVEVISNCYQLDEDLFRQFVEKNEAAFKPKEGGENRRRKGLALFELPIGWILRNFLLRMHAPHPSKGTAFGVTWRLMTTHPPVAMLLPVMRNGTFCATSIVSKKRATGCACAHFR
jgi:hypothetical protein